ncbi:MAG: type IV pilus biogenesis protein PilM [Christensenellales bacterium]|jgi:Tfp pilus assembly PilM family ATPase
MICIYMNDDRVKVIDGKKKGSKILVKKFYDIPTKTASLESGNIKDLMAFSQILQECIQDNELKKGPATFVIDNTRMVLKEMIVPDVAPVKVKQIIYNEIFTDSKGSSNTLDYIVAEKFKNEEKKKRCKIHMTYLPTDAISNIFVAGAEVDLKPKVLDIGPNATTKLIEMMIKKRVGLEETFILVDYKETFLTLYVFDQGKRQISKSTILYVAEDRVDINYVVSEIVNNVNSLLRFYESRNEDRSVSAVYLTGHISVLNDSMQELADSLSMVVSHLPCPNFVLGMDLTDFNAYSCAIGAFIRKG